MTKSICKEGIKQIDICLARLDRWRNWTNTIIIPMDDIYSNLQKMENATYKSMLQKKMKNRD